ncbi:MAG: carboxylesterase/lipase family protein [Lachnospiraceae bacterium]|nr:carboxylesterase/lipase family protein [Lachnospiraceae bacterium]MBQ2579486.1 carboxylesterase/lipase family protein [Lachnospiraceae bacterium]MBQ4372742.1 carboxylesterase/lipase family protein [Lachnospiraceae bacterium]
MEQQFIYGNDTVVQTREGKLRGFFFRGVYQFHGVNYATAERFCMPKPVEPWDGIKDAVSYGPVCPIESNPIPSGEVFIPHRFWPQDEHCQSLNIWTTKLSPKAKRPVFVWLHGGGFSDGSSIEQVAYEGDSLAKNGDVVVVTINHRLNLLGFLDMSSFGEKYHNSVNAGIADIVAALEWIQANIEVFGGDPSNVTICGQSGGGGKVQTLMQTPAAEGLFHKAIIMSGVHSTSRDSDVDQRPVILRTMELLDIQPDHPEELEKVPYARLVDAFRLAHIEFVKKEDKVIVWGPRPNDWYYGDPTVHGWCEFSKKIPLVIGTVFGEFFDHSIFALSEEGVEARMKQTFGEDASKVEALFASAYPDKPKASALAVDFACRPAALDFAKARAASCEGDVYVYQFAPTFEMCGPMEAWHCSDITFLFQNIDRTAYANVPGAGKGLEESFSGNFLDFMRAGHPSKEWSAYTAAHPITMVFGATNRSVERLDDELLEVMAKHVQPLDFEGTVKYLLLSQEKEWFY